MKSAIVHLLRPKEFRVYCRPRQPIRSMMTFTSQPSKATCVSCLTRLRRSSGKGKGRGSFRKFWTDRYEPQEQEPEIDE